MKIKNVKVNLKAKQIEITTSKNKFSLPFAKLRLLPASADPIKEIFVDPELGSQGITYRLVSGKEDSIHLDAFLDFNQDREYVRKAILHRLTLAAVEAFKKSGLSKNQVIAALETSPSQLNRLLDATFYGKTIDHLVKLFAVLDCDIDFEIKPRAA